MPCHTVSLDDLALRFTHDEDERFSRESDNVFDVLGVRQAINTPNRQIISRLVAKS